MADVQTVINGLNSVSVVVSEYVPTDYRNGALKAVSEAISMINMYHASEKMTEEEKRVHKREVNRLWQRRNKDKCRRYTKKWRDAHKDKVSMYNKTYRERLKKKCSEETDALAKDAK